MSSLCAGQARELLAAGADAGCKDRFGSSAIDMAAARGHRETVELIAQASASRAAKDSGGESEETSSLAEIIATGQHSHVQQAARMEAWNKRGRGLVRGEVPDGKCDGGGEEGLRWLANDVEEELGLDADFWSEDATVDVAWTLKTT